jgi:hypothetical protein
LVYSLILPSSLFGVVREESGAKLVVRLKQKNDCSRAERRGEGGDNFSLHKARIKTALVWIVRSGLTDLDYAQNRWDGCFRGSYGGAAPQWIHQIHHGRLG